MPQGIAEVNDISIWWEDFGDSSNPAVLLIMGANANAMQWTLEFINPLLSLIYQQSFFAENLKSQIYLPYRCHTGF